MTHASADRQILSGDIVITAVADLYAMSRKVANRDVLEFLGAYRECIDALNAACRLAGAMHRVFLYPHAGLPDYRLVHRDGSGARSVSDSPMLPKSLPDDPAQRLIRVQPL